MFRCTSGQFLNSVTATLETRFGPVLMWALEWPGERAYVLLRSVTLSAGTPELRVQAECLTSTAFASVMCDCGEQVDEAVRRVATTANSYLVYMPQEGRGWGLLSKVEIMSHMNAGLPLPQAQRRVGRADTRLDYSRIPQILAEVGEQRPVRLLTTSAQKVAALTAAGVVQATTCAPTA